MEYEEALENHRKRRRLNSEKDDLERKQCYYTSMEELKRKHKKEV
jgi:hypothetical protein